MHATAKQIDRVRILTRSEIVQVLADLKRKRRSVNTRQNLIVFRLSTCCGLRVSEIVSLKMSNVKLSGKRPHVYIPAAIAKRHKLRRVPLWWDVATLADLAEWKQERAAQGVIGADPFVCSQCTGKHYKTGETFGKPLATRNAQARFKNAIKVLGSERLSDLSIHSGRHSFCSHALAGGRSIAEVRDAAGHANIATTSIYLHVIDTDDDEPGNLFAF